MRKRKTQEKFVVMGIDQSLTGTGICMPNGVADVCRMPSGKGKLTGPTRLIHILKWLNERIDECNPTHVCWEAYSYGSKGRALFEIGELGGCVKLLVLSRGIPIIAVPPKTLKKFVTGNGNAKKDQMREAVHERWGYWYEDDNEADAHALMQYGYEWLRASRDDSPDPEIDKLMQEVKYFAVGKKMQSFAIEFS